MKVVEATVLEDNNPQSLTIELPDGRRWQELFFTSKEKVLNVLKEIKKGATVKVALNEKIHNEKTYIQGDTKDLVEGIILPKGIISSKKRSLLKRVS